MLQSEDYRLEQHAVSELQSVVFKGIKALLFSRPSKQLCTDIHMIGQLMPKQRFGELHM